MNAIRETMIKNTAAAASGALALQNSDASNLCRAAAPAAGWRYTEFFS